MIRWLRVRPLPRRARAGLVLTALGAVLLLAASCRPTPAPPPRSTATPMPPTRSDSLPRVTALPRVSEVRNEPMVRVRLATRTAEVRLAGDGPLAVGAPSASTGQRDPHAASHRFAPPLTVQHDGQRFILTDGRGQRVTWALPTLFITPTAGAITVGDAAYPGAIVLVPMTDAAGQPTRRFDVINHVPLEQYLPGVLQRELYGSWSPAAFEAQAIAARSYALFERALRADRHYDLESTVASQAYSGAATNPKALAAVRQTRGQVLVHEEVIVPAFYSSCCGGVGQDAPAAFPHLGPAIDLPPLRGQVRPDCCHASPHRTWGPIRRDARTLAARFAAWGRANRDPIAQLNGLRDIRVTHVSHSGRPARFAITDARGQQYTLAAEPFRFACNHDAPGLPALEATQKLKSSHVTVRVTGDDVHFADGHGFGHGVGMCQWGAQGLALRGQRGHDIVRHYYPGAQVVALY